MSTFRRFAYSTSALPNEGLPRNTHEASRAATPSSWHRYFSLRDRFKLATDIPSSSFRTSPTRSTAYTSTRSPLSGFSYCSTFCSEYSARNPEWEDLEAAYRFSPYSWSSIKQRFWPWNSTLFSLFGRSKLEEKARNPRSCEAIDWELRRSFIKGLLIRFFLFLVYCLMISLFYPKFGLQCASVPGAYDGPASNIFWMRLVAAAGFIYLMCAGYGNIKITRDRMERMAHCCINVAYSFLKGVNPASDEPGERDEQQRMIYECMLLCAAYPVAMIQRIRGNMCEPAVSRYCREAAATLQYLRSGHSITGGPSLGQDLDGPGVTTGNQHYVNVDHFFESFSLQLEIEYARHTVITTKHRPLTTVHITYCLRSHYENLIDLGAIDDRRGPAVREVIELMGALGREAHVNTPRDVRPRVFTWTIFICVWLTILRHPIDNCHLLVNSRIASPAQPEFPTFLTLKSMVVVSAIASLLLTLLSEAWSFWDPFNKGFNTYAWSLGIAMELDALLNQFHETEPAAMIRKHSYMPGRADIPRGSITRWAGQPSQHILPGPDPPFQPGPSFRHEQSQSQDIPSEPGPYIRPRRAPTV